MITYIGTSTFSSFIYNPPHDNPRDLLNDVQNIALNGIAIDSSTVLFQTLAFVRGVDALGTLRLRVSDVLERRAFLHRVKVALSMISDAQI